ncbi:hypothetical protein B0T24DRAFT_620933, partial [Lasiosphaeria ovina]
MTLAFVLGLLFISSAPIFHAAPSPPLSPPAATTLLHLGIKSRHDGSSRSGRGPARPACSAASQALSSIRDARNS